MNFWLEELYARTHSKKGTNWLWQGQVNAATWISTNSPANAGMYNYFRQTGGMACLQGINANHWKVAPIVFVQSFFPSSWVFQLKYIFQTSPTQFEYNTCHCTGTNLKFKYMAGTHSPQLVTTIFAKSLSKTRRACLKSFPSNAIKLVMNVEMKIGAKRTWSQNNLLSTLVVDCPGIRVIRNPYQLCTTGATKPNPSNEKRPVRIQSTAKLSSPLLVSIFSSDWDCLSLCTMYWQIKSALPEIIPLVIHFVMSGWLSSFLAYHEHVFRRSIIVVFFFGICLS